MLVKQPAEYPEPDQRDASREMLHAEESNANATPSAPPSPKAVLCSPLSGQWGHLK
jgi:hypothetical protein